MLNPAPRCCRAAACAQVYDEDEDEGLEKSKAELDEVLRKCKLGALKGTFEKNNINSLDVLGSITRDEFAELKVLVGDRKKLMAAKKASRHRHGRGTVRLSKTRATRVSLWQNRQTLP